MSFNRGAKRNSFGNRNFNRSGGGGGNPIRNNGGGGSMGGGMGGSSGGGGGGGGVNPWESGMMPGRGLLPTPNNNLSLSSPQAQLVIASNLLSNLLRTQQEVQPQVNILSSPAINRCRYFTFLIMAKVDVEKGSLTAESRKHPERARTELRWPAKLWARTIQRPSYETSHEEPTAATVQ